MAIIAFKKVKLGFYVKNISFFYRSVKEVMSCSNYRSRSFFVFFVDGAFYL